MAYLTERFEGLNLFKIHTQKPSKTRAERVLESFQRGRKGKAEKIDGREASGMSFDQINALNPRFLK